MSTVAKILVVLNLGLAFFFLASASNFLGQQEKFKSQYEAEVAAHERDNAEKDKEIAQLRSQLQTARRQIQDLEREKSEAVAEAGRLESINTQLTQAYNELSANATKAVRAVEQLTNSLNAARDNIQGLQTDNNQLRDNLRAAQQDRDAKVAMVNSLQLQLEQETESRKAVERRLAAATDTIDRQAFELQWYKERFPGTSPTPQPPHKGQVLAADNAANVYVISLGEEDGVQAGFQYIVSRGGEYIATVQITDVEAKKSAGRALRDISKGDVRRGDMVINGQ